MNGVGVVILGTLWLKASAYALRQLLRLKQVYEYRRSAICASQM